MSVEERGVASEAYKLRLSLATSDRIASDLA